jgi:molybdate transport system regulatory protein
MRRSQATKARTLPRWRLLHGDEIALGPGKVELLEAIAAAGSISGAARELEMSYRRAWLLVETMNRRFRKPLVATSSCRRAGANLTREGVEVVALYRRIEAESLAATRNAWSRIRSLLAKPG